ncbi:MAG: DUF342 domain-containing protein [Candidatus Hydrogenedentota bacterium]|nr:MAG: DUF342 domain-containing protein [Candidatus Hydrogenedentota bacterium]
MKRAKSGAGTSPGRAEVTVEAPTLEEARILGAKQLNVKPKFVELEIEEAPTSNHPFYTVTVRALRQAARWEEDLAHWERLAGAEKGEEKKPVAAMEKSEETLLKEALAEVDGILEDPEFAADPELIRSIRDLSTVLDPDLADQLDHLRLEAVSRRAAAGDRDGVIEIQQNPHRREAYVTFRPPSGNGRPLAAEEVLARLEEIGAVPPPREELEKILERVRRPRSGHVIHTVHYRPARFDLKMSEDGMALVLFLYPAAEYGEAVKFEEIEKAVADLKIQGEIKWEEVKKALHRCATERPEVIETVIAQGTPPVDGEDGSVEWKIPVKEEESGWILDETSGPVIVDAGTLLARITPGSAGEPGRDLRGKPLPAKPGRTPRLNTGANVTKEKRGTEFRASVAGRVLLEGLVISIKPYAPGTAEVRVSSDGMSAELFLTPPIGDAPGPSREEVEELIEKAGIKHGLDAAEVERLWNEWNERRRPISGTIARGTAAVEGKAGWVEVPVEDFISMVHSEDRVDHRERSALRPVRTGDLIAVLYEGEEGTPGTDVRGNPVFPPEIPEVLLEAGPGVRRDGNMYYADRDGHLVHVGDRISVEDVFHIDGDVTMEIGNIHHNGPVVIDGSVGDGFLVEAEGEVTIRDNVGGSVVRTNGNVRVGNGVIGRQRGTVDAGADVEVRFVESGTLLAGGEIRVAVYSLQSRLESEGVIRVRGEERGIIGGEVIARAGIETTHAGSPSFVPTLLKTGESPLLKRRARAADRKFREYQNELARLRMIEEQFRKECPDLGAVSPERARLYQRLIRSRVTLKVRLKEVGVERVRCLAEMAKVPPGEIVVKGTLHPGTRIQMKDLEMKIETRLQGVRFRLDEEEGRIEVLPLEEREYRGKEDKERK